MLDKPPKIERNNATAEFLALAKELSERGEKYPFPGIDALSYEILKKEQAGIPQEYVLDIDAFMEELRVEGIRIVLEKGRVYVVPYTHDFKNDSVDSIRYLFPRHLDPRTVTNPALKKLIDQSKIHPLI